MMEQCKTCIYKNYKDRLAGCKINKLDNAIYGLVYQICESLPIVKDQIQVKEEYKCSCYISKDTLIDNET